MQDKAQKTGNSRYADREWDDTSYRSSNDGKRSQNGNYDDDQETSSGGSQRQEDYQGDGNRGYDTGFSRDWNQSRNGNNGSSFGGGRGYQGRDFDGGRQYESGYGGGQYEGRQGGDQYRNRDRGYQSQSQYGSNYGSGGNRRDNGFGQDGSLSGSNYSQGGRYSGGNSYGSGSQYSDQGQNYSGNSGYNDTQYSGYGQRGSQYGNTGYGQGRNGSNGQSGNWGGGYQSFGSTFGQGSSQYGSSYGDNQQTTHKGKGPKGYRRSDDRIKEDVNDRFTDDHQLDASDIEVDVNSGEVKLTGTVNNREAKRRAEELAESISGVANVENSIRVKQGTTDSGSNDNGAPSASSKGNTTGSANSDKSKK